MSRRRDRDLGRRDRDRGRRGRDRGRRGGSWNERQSRNQFQRGRERGRERGRRQRRERGSEISYDSSSSSSSDGERGENTTLEYLEDKCIVSFQGISGKFMRIRAKEGAEVDCRGKDGGRLTKFRVHRITGENKIKLQQVFGDEGRWLRIQKNLLVNGKGIGGGLTVFEVKDVGDGKVSLSSSKFSDKYIGFDGSGACVNPRNLSSGSNEVQLKVIVRVDANGKKQEDKKEPSIAATSSSSSVPIKKEVVSKSHTVDISALESVPVNQPQKPSHMVDIASLSNNYVVVSSNTQKKEPKIDRTPLPKDLPSFLAELELSSCYDKMKSDGVKFKDLGIFLEDPKALDDYIPKKFHQVKFLMGLKKYNERKKEQETGKDKLSGEYNWNGKGIKIQEKFAYFENNRYEFEMLTSNVYKIDIAGNIFVFIWDDEDEMLRVVRTKSEYEFIKRMPAVANSASGGEISGEYDWNGMVLDIKKNFCYFALKRFAFEKVASTVYTVQMGLQKFVFNWDKEDTVLGVVQVEGDGFFERIDKKVFVKKIV